MQYGLSPMRAQQKTLIAYACGPGGVAVDETQNGKNGFFIENLLKYITIPNRDIEDVFRNVAHDIELQTHGLQLCHRSSSLTEEVCLIKDNVKDLQNTKCANISAASNIQPKNTPYSFANPESGKSARFPFNQPITNTQIQPPLPTSVFTSSIFNQQVLNDKSQSSSTNTSEQIFSSNKTINPTQNNTPAFSKKLSDPPTPTSQQPSSINQEQEVADAPPSLADDSLLAKKFHETLRDSKDFVVDRTDQTSPFYSTKKFEDFNLKPDLLKGIYSMGFRIPSKIQEVALPPLLSNPPKNIIAQSQPGTGKTVTFSLAILSHIDPDNQSPQALILAATYELAIHIGSVIEKMAQFLPYISIAYAVRGSDSIKKANLVRGQLLTESIIVGTPGTVEDWCIRRRVIDLSKLRICCIDEADLMIAASGFKQTCTKFVRDLNISSCQIMVFSAIYSEEVMTFAREIVPNAVVVKLKREKQMIKNIKQFFIRCYDSQQKYDAIQQIYAFLNLGQTMVFCRTKATARNLAVWMANQGHSIRELTSALDIDQRATIIDQFRQGSFRVLVSTNVIVRGIDINDVILVVHFDMPVTVDFQPDYDTYLRRNRHCGRFGRLGYVFNLIGSEKDFNIMKEIEQYFSHPIDEITIEAISHLEE